MMANSISVVLVDDELDSIEVLEYLLNDSFPEVQVGGIAQSIEEAYEVITAIKPDLVFLDIQLKSETAFDLLNMEFIKPFEIIFITAYSEYAIRAFKHQALSYLLKPIDVNDFIRATERAIGLIYAQRATKTQYNSQKPFGERIAISTGSEIEYISPLNILYAMADGSYCQIYLNDGSTRIVSRNLKYVESKLDSLIFFRPHRSYLVNSQHIKKWNKAEGGMLILTNNSTIPLSREGKAILEKFV